MPRLQRFERHDGVEVAINPMLVRLVWKPNEGGGVVRLAFDENHTIDVKGGIRRVEELLGDSLNSE
jgi:hypothetical protein